MKKKICSLLLLVFFSGCAFIPRNVDIAKIEPRIIYPRDSFTTPYHIVLLILKTVDQTKTGLVWTKKDSYADTGICKNWDDSKSYVSRLSTSGHS
jgi:hypothetical protein